MLFFALQVVFAEPSVAYTSSSPAFFFDEERQDAPLDAVVQYYGWDVDAVLLVDGQEIELTTVEVSQQDPLGSSYIQPPAGGWPVDTDLVVNLVRRFGGDVDDSLAFRSDGHVAAPPPSFEITYTTSDWTTDDRPYRDIWFTFITEDEVQPWDRPLTVRSSYWGRVSGLEHRAMQHFSDGEVDPPCFSFNILSEAGVLGEEQVVCPEGRPAVFGGPPDGEDGVGGGRQTGSGAEPSGEVVANSSSSSGCATVGSFSPLFGLFSVGFLFWERRRRLGLR